MARTNHKGLVSAGTADGDNVIRVRGFQIHQRDIIAFVMLLAIAIFMISIAVTYGQNNCKTPLSSVPATLRAVTASLGLTPEVPSTFVMGGGSERLEYATASNNQLRGVTKEWAVASPALRGVTREWADAKSIDKKSIDNAFANVRRKVVAEKVGGIDNAFANVRRKVERATAGAHYAAKMLTDNQQPPMFTNPNNNKQPGTMYKLGPGEQQVPPLYDLKFGYLTNGQQAGDFMTPARKASSSALQTERLRAERDQSEGDGSVFEGWEGGHGIKDGIASDTWQGDKDWASKKDEVIQPMREVCDLFDGLFNSKVFPGSTTEPTSIPGEFQIKASGGCVDVGRYYEYVQATMSAQMGDESATLPTWASNNAIDLGLDRLNESIPGLRGALVVDCASAPVYRLGTDRSVVEVASGKTVQFTVPWPADGSVLLTHVMKI